MRYGSSTLVLLILGASASAGCTKDNPSSCDSNDDCEQPLPVCDVDGTIGGTANECVAEPEPEPEPGQFRVAWTLTAGSQETSCAEVGVGAVSLLSTLAGTAQGIEDVFPCDNGQGTTAGLPPGMYTVVVSVLEEGTDALLGQSVPITEDIAEDEITDLGAFNFAFAAVGDVDFGVDYGASGGSNCDSGAGGEGVEDQGTNLTLVGGGQCIAVPLAVDGVVDVPDICSEIPLCVEPTAVQTLHDLDEGEYALAIDGLFLDGATSVSCFRSIDIFTVDGDLDLGVLEVPFDDTEDPEFCGGI